MSNSLHKYYLVTPKVFEKCISNRKPSEREVSVKSDLKDYDSKPNNLHKWKKVQQEVLPKHLKNLDKSRKVARLQSNKIIKIEAPSVKDTFEKYWGKPVISSKEVKLHSNQKGTADNEEEEINEKEDVVDGSQDYAELDLNQIEDADVSMRDLQHEKSKYFTPIAARTRTQNYFKNEMREKANQKRKFLNVDYEKTGLTPKIKNSKLHHRVVNEKWVPYETLYK